ncbi:hypothetical protein RJT34_24851 [Clitoria ternatea]|uniref:Uncharacterized protein n=1 Tax=Clitoria ternatea TaxID=43366 RepID=A0AAN9FVJ1_CLITE
MYLKCATKDRRQGERACWAILRTKESENKTWFLYHDITHKHRHANANANSCLVGCVARATPSACCFSSFFPGMPSPFGFFVYLNGLTPTSFEWNVMEAR